MTEAEVQAATEAAAKLSDEAIIVAFGWFSFGAKASVTSSPPHANMESRQAALDELLSLGLITHEHEYHKRHKIDRRHFKGTPEIGSVLGTARARAILKAVLNTPNTSDGEER